MKIAGFWRRVFRNLVDSLALVFTLGIYLIIFIILFFKGSPSWGMRLTGTKYSSNRMGRLALWRLLFWLLRFLTVGILLIVDFIRIILKKGTLAEKKADNFTIIA
ncbi:hypothetical protein [Mycoplasma feriruminatoris]|uniref:RDD family protein n=1 Tax=Mycoplasma feriruminatoris TaxID=1179777 RepID=A0AAQ3DND0_9MOLU|nr:hypothetical protein [Mycoplasma feriruminatoris]UKS53730.1 hypothetical protein D500_00050 [Mycoplasma feriruminatoris]WFQ89827.1 hypothetical protein MFERI11561_00046 [Mycoplasma feriruminatoris]WFQ90647.1 hypothetical protein MFERI13461_00049 [Mycoplasma feriruminatoris]WFQ91465.1 hypothetical protein MFERI14815_00046 [Mycoplasma feriruminatoris]WFQ92291.1 hypothetical protein MFERI14822_00046 [Mycoplasma feriruminatoris]